MKLLDDVYYYAADKWNRSFVISIIKDKRFPTEQSLFRYLVAGYGPSISHSQVLDENEYIRYVDSQQIDRITEIAKKSK